MKYKKITNNDKTVHIIDSNRFKEMHIVIYFTKKADPSDRALGNLLTHNLTYSCKKYNSKSLIASRGEELYGARVSSFFGYTGNSQAFNVGLQILNPKYTEDRYLDESLDFLYEILLNPNVDKNGFNEEIFNITKRDYINGIKSLKDHPAEYGNILYNEIIFKDTVCERLVPTVEEIEKISKLDLYNYYKSLFNGKYKIDIVIYGENSSKVVDKVCDKFKDIKGNNEIFSFDIESNFSNKLITKTKPFSFKQSRLYIGYRLKDLTEHERRHVLRLYDIILGGMTNSLLFKYVREEYSLCYSIYSNFNRYGPILTVCAGINKVNYEETKKRIFETLELMKDKTIIESYIDQAKETFNTFINSYYDDIYGQINHFYYKEFDIVEDVEKLRDNLNKVSVEEIIELNKKLKLSVIFFMKGDE